MTNERTTPWWRRIPVPILVLVAILAAVAGYRFLIVAEPAVAGHPAPREEVAATEVVSPERYDGYPRISATYEKAIRIPEILDGLYCHCGCSEHSGHRSLLTCFESDHAARCDICLGEADLAFRMVSRGASLDEIRRAVDSTFGR